MSWKVEPAFWIAEPPLEAGELRSNDALDAQARAAMDGMPEGIRVPESLDPAELSGTPRSAAISGEFIVVDDDEVEDVEPPPKPPADAAAPYSEALEVELEREATATPPEGPRVPPGASADEPPVGLFIPNLTAAEASPAEASPAEAEPVEEVEAVEAVEALDPGEEAAQESEPLPADELPPGTPAPVGSEPSVEMLVDDADYEEVEELDEADASEAEEETPEAGHAPPPAASTPPAAPPTSLPRAAPPSGPPTSLPRAAPPKPPEKKRRHWADDVFMEHYLSTLPADADAAAEADVAFIEASLELQPGVKILDAGCGNGRHAFAFADHGHEVVGLDSSLDMLLAAGRRNEGREHPVNFLKMDMRELPSDAKYDLVCCLGSSFGYYDDDDNRAILERFRSVLGPDGRLVLQIFNRDYMAPRVPCRSWWQGPRCMVLDETEMNYFANRLRVHRTIVFDDGRQYEHYMFIKAFTLHDIGKLLSSVGLRVREVSGSRDTRGRFYGAASPNLWIVAEPKGES